MRKNQVAWWLWATGTVLVVLSWINVVSHVIGWCGFAIGLAGTVLSWGIRPPHGSSSTQERSGINQDV
ncbi:MAG: hypothetical protein ABIW82_09965 [Dokdonella sp.]